MALQWSASYWWAVSVFATLAISLVVRVLFLRQQKKALQLTVRPPVRNPSTIAASSSEVSGGGASVLSPSEYRSFPLKERIIINHNVRIFRFALPDPKARLGLPIGQHLSFRAKTEFSETIVCRSYTPISDDEDVGYFDLLVKVYPTGKMSRHLDSLKVGQTIDVRGPKGNFLYQPNKYKHVGMLAGGTGITPMLQIIKAVSKNPEDKTQISLIFANVTAEDILLKDDLDRITSNLPHIRVFYTLDRPSDDWKQGRGFITTDMIKEHLHAPTEPDSVVLLCGPDPMVKAQIANLTSIGFAENTYFKF